MVFESGVFYFNNNGFYFICQGADGVNRILTMLGNELSDVMALSGKIFFMYSLGFILVSYF